MLSNIRSHIYFWFWHEIYSMMTTMIRTRKYAKSYLKLLEIFLLGLDHWKDQTITFSHALSMWRFDIFLDNLLPPSSTEPSPKEALHFLNFLQFGRVLGWVVAEGSEIWYVVEIVDQLLLLLDGVTRCGAYTPSSRCRWKWWTRRFLAKYTNLLST